MERLFEELQSNYCLRGFLSENRLKLFVTLLYPESEDEESPREKPLFTMTRDVLLDKLKNHMPTERIHVGVLDDIITDFNAGKETEKHRRILVGTEPKPGKNGKLLLLKRPYTGAVEVSIDSSGKADLSNLNLFENVHVDDVVARIYPPTPGVDGVDVLGVPLPATAGTPLEISLEETLIRKPGDGDARYEVLISLSEGYLKHDGQTMGVSDELHIPGDLDLEYGSIDFIGRVSVQGDVVPGVSVTAKKGIEIQGACMGGSLRSADGPVVVHGGVFGTGSCHILSGAHFEASIVNNATVETEGDIIITKEVRESLLISGSAVIAKQGTILGGCIKAVRGVEAKVIGSDGGVRTTVHLCRPCEASFEYVQLLLNIEKHKEILELLQVHLGPYAEQRKSGVPLSGVYEDKMLHFISKLERVEKSLEYFSEKKTTLEADDTGTEGACVSASSKLWEGTTILSRGEEHYIQESINGPLSICYHTETESIDVDEYREVVEAIVKEEAA